MSRAECACCHKFIDTQELVVAVAGLLYCSELCAKRHYNGKLGHYEDMFEFVSTFDIGIKKGGK